MPLGTLDRRPPPLFHQGLSARSKLVFFTALALFLMVADTRLKMSAPIREAIALVLTPLQHALLVPVEMARGGAGYFQGLQQARQAEADARALLVRQAERSALADRLAAENAQLRALLEMKPAITTRSLAAEVLYEAADPFSRRLFINVGRNSGIRLGSPVVNERGVLGQVTRVYPLSAEVTLLADRDAAIPVVNARTQQRSAAFGGITGQRAATMELRFMSGNADVQTDDELLTSGVDGIYPPGLKVARVASVERRVDSTFARVLLVPAAPADTVRHLLVLEPLSVQLPDRPETEAAPTKRPRVNPREKQP
jgi:rod shape-determining protein MreC